MRTISTANVVKVYSMIDGKRPESFCDCTGPFCHGVEQNSPGGGLYGANGPFSQAILPVAANATVCEGLVGIGAGGSNRRGSVDTVVRSKGAKVDAVLT